MSLKAKYTKEEIEKLKHKLANKHNNAAKRGIVCTIGMEDMLMLGWKLLGNGCCDYTGLPFSTKVVESGCSENPKYPSLERIDDTKGYIRGNVCVVMIRANQLKDRLVDKSLAINTTDPIDREILRGMILNMSKDLLEKLKTKYIPQQENKMNTEEIMQGAMSNVSVAVAKEHSVDSYVPPEQDLCSHLRGRPEERAASSAREPVAEETAAPVEEKQKLPDDVAVALAYANYCKTFADVGMNVSVTYAQFKAKYIRNTCSLTQEKLSGEPKAILIMDLNVGFAKDNFIIVSKKMEKALTQLMISTQLSLPKVAAMLNKVV